jgi:hypothetical protein
VTGIQFVTDAKGRKLAVQISLRKYGKQWQDFCDGIISEERSKEKGIPLARVKADLMKRGRVAGQRPTTVHLEEGGSPCEFAQDK